MYPAVNFSIPIFRAIWFTLINDLTNIETKKANPISLKNLHTSQSKTYMTGYHTATQHH